MPQSPSLEDLLEMAKKEDGLTLTKAGHPVAQVIPLPEKLRQRVAPLPRKLGLHPGAWVVSDDFDEPLADEFWMGQESVTGLPGTTKKPAWRWRLTPTVHVSSLFTH